MAGHRNARFDAVMLPLLDDAFDFAFRLSRDDKAAEELTQEAFTRAFEAFHRFEPGTSARAWLFTIVRNLCANTERARRRHPTVELDEAAQVAAEVQGADLTADLDQAISRLPVKLREVVVLDLKGMTCREISAVVSCPPGTVMSRLFTARRVLRELLGPLVDARGEHG